MEKNSSELLYSIILQSEGFIMGEYQKAKVFVSKEKLNQLVQLSEEADMSILIGKALSLYLTLLKKQTEGYSIMLVSLEDEKISLAIDLADL